MAWYSEFRWKDIQEVKKIIRKKKMDIQNTKQFKRWLNIIFLFIFIYKFFSYIIKYGRGECFVIFLILWLMKQFRYLSDVLRLLVGGLLKKTNCSTNIYRFSDLWFICVYVPKISLKFILWYWLFDSLEFKWEYKLKSIYFLAIF